MSISSAAALSRARFSMITCTSGLSQGRTSIDPSKVARVTSALPEVEKCFSSRSTYLPRSAPMMMSPQPALSTAARTAAAKGKRISADSAMTGSSRQLDGGRVGSVRPNGKQLRGGSDLSVGPSRVDELTADVGLDDRELPVEDDKV